MQKAGVNGQGSGAGGLVDQGSLARDCPAGEAPSGQTQWAGFPCVGGRKPGLGCQSQSSLARECNILQHSVTPVSIGPPFATAFREVQWASFEVREIIHRTIVRRNPYEGKGEISGVAVSGKVGCRRGRRRDGFQPAQERRVGWRRGTRIGNVLCHQVPRIGDRNNENGWRRC